MKKLLVLSLLACIFYLVSCTSLFIPPAFADSQFSVSYDLTYKVAESGITTVTQNFKLVNKSSDFFPKEYLAKIGKKEIANITAFDKTGPLEVKLIGIGEDLSVDIKFRDLAAGVGNNLNWTLTYQTSQIARHHNQIWEIYIPRPQDVTDIDDYTIGLYVPESFGKPFLIKPAPQTSDHVWLKNELTTNGIFISYFLGEGDNPYQIYDYSLRYHLYNSKLYPVETEIALPSDTNYQKIYLSSLVPQPVNVRIDADGNWLAKFSLGPAAGLDVLASGSAAVYFHPQFPSTLSTVSSSSFSSPIRAYLARQHYWEISDPRVMALAKNNPKPDQIYSLVVKSLQYDFARSKNNISRLGATGILNKPTNAICLEFTDLFIAVARAAGIPAREVNGFAQSVDQSQQPTTITSDSLHSWPEYYDSQTNQWIMVDPTWGNTTGGTDYFNSLDTDHLAFVIKGQDSSSPTPAGTYKTSDKQSNDVEIAYHQGDFDLNQPTRISLRTNLMANITSGFSYPGKVYLDNNGPVIYEPDILTISAQKLELTDRQQPTPAIPPFGHAELGFNVNPIGWSETSNDIISVRFAGYQKDYSVNLTPIYTNKYIFVIGGLTALGILSIIAQITRSLFWSYKKPKMSKHTN